MSLLNGKDKFIYVKRAKKKKKKDSFFSTFLFSLVPFQSISSSFTMSFQY